MMRIMTKYGVCTRKNVHSGLVQLSFKKYVSLDGKSSSPIWVFTKQKAKQILKVIAGEDQSLR